MHTWGRAAQSWSLNLSCPKAARSFPVSGERCRALVVSGNGQAVAVWAVTGFQVDVKVGKVFNVLSKEAAVGPEEQRAGWSSGGVWLQRQRGGRLGAADPSPSLVTSPCGAPLPIVQFGCLCCLKPLISALA